MNDADRALVIERLRQGCGADAIHTEVPDVSVGEIAAIAETEGLTQAHRKAAGASPGPDVDPQLARALAALAWGENSHTARIRNLASRVRTGLNELQQLQHDAAAIEKAEREVAAAAENLTKAQAKLRRLKNTGKSPKPATASSNDLDDKYQRNQIRAWARAQGMHVAQAGSISKDVMDAWNNRNDKRPSVPGQRQAR